MNTIRFSIDNFFKPVSFEQYKETAEKLEHSLLVINPKLTSTLLLTTDQLDYDTYGSLSIPIPEKQKALNRRKEYGLNKLTEKLWNESFKTGLYINENNYKNLFMVALSVEQREPKSLKFYGQCLDSESQGVFDSFRKTKPFQKLGDGYSKPSDFATHYLLSRFRER